MKLIRTFFVNISRYTFIFNYILQIFSVLAKFDHTGGDEIEQVFLYGLFGIGLLTILYVLFADAIDGMDAVYSTRRASVLPSIHLCIRLYFIEANQIGMRK